MFFKKTKKKSEHSDPPNSISQRRDSLKEPTKIKYSPSFLQNSRKSNSTNLLDLDDQHNTNSRDTKEFLASIKQNFLMRNSVHENNITAKGFKFDDLPPKSNQSTTKNLQQISSKRSSLRKPETTTRKTSNLNSVRFPNFNSFKTNRSRSRDDMDENETATVLQASMSIDQDAMNSILKREIMNRNSIKRDKNKNNNKQPVMSRHTSLQNGSPISSDYKLYDIRPSKTLNNGRPGKRPKSALLQFNNSDFSAVHLSSTPINKHMPCEDVNRSQSKMFVSDYEPNNVQICAKNKPRSRTLPEHILYPEIYLQDQNNNVSRAFSRRSPSKKDVNEKNRHDHLNNLEADLANIATLSELKLYQDLEAHLNDIENASGEDDNEFKLIHYNNNNDANHHDDNQSLKGSDFQDIDQLVLLQSSKNHSLSENRRPSLEVHSEHSHLSECEMQEIMISSGHSRGFSAKKFGGLPISPISPIQATFNFSNEGNKMIANNNDNSDSETDSNHWRGLVVLELYLFLSNCLMQKKKRSDSSYFVILSVTT